ncbi:MAG: hypothetical protein ABH814_02640, partial [bacterium]
FFKNPIAAEKISFVILFTAAGLSMWYSAGLIFGKGKKILPLAAAIYWLFNFYTLSLWQIFRQDGTFLMIFLPLFLGFYIAGIEKRISNQKLILGVTLLSILGGSAAANPPAILPIIPIFALYSLITLIRKRGSLKRLVKFNLKFLVLLVLINSYWIIPFVYQNLNSGVLWGSAKEMFQLDYWLGWTSAHTSIGNVLKLQGDPALFDGYGFKAFDRYLPFFEKYQQSPNLNILGWLFAALSFLGLLAGRSFLHIFLGLITLFSLILSAGTHPPFDKIYPFLQEKIPLSWAIRSPWPKFALVTTLGYTLLTASFLDKLYQKAKIKLPLGVKSAALAVLIFPIINLFYMQSFIKGEMFPKKEDRTVLAPMHIQIPPYIGEAYTYLNSKEEDFKILLLPQDRTDNYTWGFGSATNLSQNFSKKPLLFEQYGEGSYTPHPIDEQIQALYKAIYQGNLEGVTTLAGNLGVRYFIQRNDFNYGLYGDYDSPEYIKEKLSKIAGLTLDKTFGKWDVYRYNEKITPLIYTAETLPKITNETPESNQLEIEALNQNYLNTHGNYLENVIYTVNPEETIKLKYKLSFSYKTDPSKNPQFYIWQTNKAGEQIAKDETWFGKAAMFEGYFKTVSQEGSITLVMPANITPSDSWQKIDTVVTPRSDTQGIGIMAQNIELKDVVIESISEPTTPDYSQKTATFKKTAFKKINPTKYQIKGRLEKGVLVFNQNFDIGWQLKVDGQAVDKQKHFVANGFANGWYIEGGSQAVLEFFPQKLFYFAIAISIATLLAISAGVLKKHEKKS